MKRNEILLSQGSILWYGMEKFLQCVEDIGFDGLEILPTRKASKEVKNLLEKYGQNWHNHISNYSKIKSIHQNWRLDIGLDKEYGINLMPSLLAFIIRFLFFPKVTTSNKYISMLSKHFKVPVVVHHINNKWTKDSDGKEFLGGILYEIFNTEGLTKEKLKNWLEKKQHGIVVDTRDDQSLLWAKNHGFSNYKEFWSWIGLDKIKSLQLTLIGTKGIKKILHHRECLAEKQLLWLNQNKWKGSVVVEVNPVILYFLSKRDLKKGLTTILAFARQTLEEGKKWST